jgi:NAD(P)-dependent dehydrogenase (short-subunit alcohol dehydrogenase family)
MANGEMFRRVLNTGFSTKFGLADHVIRKMTANQQLTSNGSGVIVGTFSNNASAYTNWTQMSGIYDEFRCVGGRMTVTCAVPNSTNLCTTAVIAFDNNDVSSNLSSVTNGLDYSQSLNFPAVWDNERKVQLVAVVSPTANNGNWYATTNSIPYPAGFKVYCSGLTASQVYWNVTTEYIMEFRGSQ